MKTFLTYIDEYANYDALGTYATGGASTGPGMGQYVPIADLNAQSEKQIKKSDLDQVEKYADRIFASLGIDVEFTRHFLDRANDKRNVKQITPSELTRLFKQTYKKYGKKIAQLGPDAEAVINDMKTDINMPFVLNLKGGELELIAKTVMRKKDFKTSGPKMSFENYINEKRAKKAVAGGKVQKLVTAFGYSFNGKNYKEIDMELVGIDNSSKIVTFNIIHPAEIFGYEIKIPFKNLRRGRYMATDTSKINEDAEDDELARDMAAAQRKMQGAKEKKTLKVRHKQQMDRAKSRSASQKKSLRDTQGREKKSAADSVKRDIQTLRKKV